MHQDLFLANERIGRLHAEAETRRMAQIAGRASVGTVGGRLAAATTVALFTITVAFGWAGATSSNSGSEDGEVGLGLIRCPHSAVVTPRGCPPPIRLALATNRTV